MQGFKDFNSKFLVRSMALKLSDHQKNVLYFLDEILLIFLSYVYLMIFN